MSKYQILLLFSIIINIATKESKKIGFLAEKENETIDLDPPVTTGGKPLYQALNQRRSHRSFVAGEKLSTAELSQLLWAGYGPNRPDGLRTAPSCHGMLSLDLYVFLESGVYKYLPTKQQLELLVKRDYRAVTGNDDYVPNAAVNICYVGVLERLSYIGDIEGRKMAVQLDTGHSAMNMLLYCSSNNLKCVPRANIIEKGLLQLLSLSDKEYHIPLCFSAGR